VIALRDHPFKTSACSRGGGVKNLPNLLTDSTKKLPTVHSEDLPTYGLPLCLRWGSNPCLYFITFNFFEFQFIERKLKSDKVKARIRTRKLRSNCQSANHYTIEAFIKKLILLINVINCIKFLLINAKWTKIGRF
jgi:hypothetical protein